VRCVSCEWKQERRAEDEEGRREREKGRRRRPLALGDRFELDPRMPALSRALTKHERDLGRCEGGAREECCDPAISRGKQNATSTRTTSASQFAAAGAGTRLAA
jgi:hypothetical protein